MMRLGAGQASICDSSPFCATAHSPPVPGPRRRRAARARRGHEGGGQRAAGEARATRQGAPRMRFDGESKRRLTRPFFHPSSPQTAPRITSKRIAPPSVAWVNGGHRHVLQLDRRCAEPAPRPRGRSSRAGATSSSARGAEHHPSAALAADTWNG